MPKVLKALNLSKRYYEKYHPQNTISESDVIASPGWRTDRMSTSGGGKKASTAAATSGAAESPYLRRIMERRTAASSTAEGGPPFPSSYPPIEGSSMDLDLGGPGTTTGTDSREGRNKDPLLHLSMKLVLFSLKFTIRLSRKPANSQSQRFTTTPHSTFRIALELRYFLD